VLRGPENEFETPKSSSGEGNGEGLSPPQPTKGSGGASYGFWCILSLIKQMW